MRVLAVSCQVCFPTNTCVVCFLSIKPHMPSQNTVQAKHLTTYITFEAI